MRLPSNILGSVAALSAAFVLPAPARAALRVVTTMPDLAAVASELGGKLLSVQAMSLATQDPHFVDAKPSLALELSKADLLLRSAWTWRSAGCRRCWWARATPRSSPAPRLPGLLAVRAACWR